jgi:hypothetical protein
MRLTTTALLLLCVGCVGCVGCTDGSTQSTVYDIGPRVVREFKLSDGTRCVSQRHGITCDWQHSRNEVE